MPLLGRGTRGEACRTAAVVVVEGRSVARVVEQGGHRRCWMRGKTIIEEDHRLQGAATTTTHTAPRSMATALKTTTAVDLPTTITLQGRAAGQTPLHCAVALLHQCAAAAMMTMMAMQDDAPGLGRIAAIA